MTPVVRPAIEEDADDVKACVVAAFQGYTVRIGQPPRPMRLDYLAEIRNGRVWVAEVGSEIVGAIAQYKTDLGFYVDVVAVHPKDQGQGIGHALLGFAEEEALRQGCRSIYLCTNAKMTENLVFYPRMGYREYERATQDGFDRVYFSKALRQPRSEA